MKHPKDRLHVAIIPDGNRRWAKKQGLFALQGHKKAMNVARNLLEWCQKSGVISTMTFWGFSTENWKRSGEEVSHLMRLFEDFLTQERPKLRVNNTRFLHSGRKDRMPKSLIQLMADISTETCDETDFTLHLALDYGGKDEVVRAVQKIQNTKDITEETIRQHLDNPDIPPIDLVVRTSGEQRTSNFFLWQSAYAEWFFVQKFFPEFTPEDLQSIVADFNERERRFGA